MGYPTDDDFREAHRWSMPPNQSKWSKAMAVIDAVRAFASTEDRTMTAREHKRLRVVYDEFKHMETR